MPHTANFDCVAIGADKEETIVADAQPKLFSSLQSFHVAHARFREAVQRGEDVHRDGLAQAADIGPGWTGPNNPLHFGSRKRSISS